MQQASASGAESEAPARGRAYPLRDALAVGNRALRDRGDRADRDSGPLRALHRLAERRARAHRRHGRRPRRRDGRVRARGRGGARRLGHHRVLGGGVHRAQVRGRRVPDRARRSGACWSGTPAMRPSRPCASRSRDLPPGGRRQRAEPQDGALLPRLPAAVRRSRLAGTSACRRRSSASSGSRSPPSATRSGHSAPAARRASCARAHEPRAIERKASGGILIGLGVLATLAHPTRQ